MKERKINLPKIIGISSALVGIAIVYVLSTQSAITPSVEGLSHLPFIGQPTNTPTETPTPTYTVTATSTNTSTLTPTQTETLTPTNTLKAPTVRATPVRPKDTVVAPTNPNALIGPDGLIHPTIPLKITWETLPQNWRNITRVDGFVQPNGLIAGSDNPSYAADSAITTLVVMGKPVVGADGKGYLPLGYSKDGQVVRVNLAIDKRLTLPISYESQPGKLPSRLIDLTTNSLKPGSVVGVQFGRGFNLSGCTKPGRCDAIREQVGQFESSNSQLMGIKGAPIPPGNIGLIIEILAPKDAISSIDKLMN